MPRPLSILVLMLVVAGCAHDSPGTASPSASRPSAAPTTTRATPSPSATLIPSPSPVPASAWTVVPVALLTEAGNPATSVAHVGIGFPVSPTSVATFLPDDRWLEVEWRTPGREGTAWVPESSLVFRVQPGVAHADIDALDSDLGAYLTGLGDRAGVEVYDATRGTVYAYNATHEYTTASSVKVPIMLAFLAQVEAEEREPTAPEKALLTEMIEKSMDYAATALWEQVGGAKGLTAFMKQIGVEGLSPYEGGWSWSTISPDAMVGLLTKLHEGTILNRDHRELALYLMEHVIDSQRIGVADTAPAGATVAMKIGRWWYDESRGGTVMSSSGIVSLGSEAYVISVYTDHNVSMPQGEATVRHVCGTIAGLLLGDPA